MAYKEFVLNSGIKYTVYKRRDCRNVRISISSHGAIRVSIPSWTSYNLGVQFASKKQNWIEENLSISGLMTDGQAIGKAHHLYFKSDKVIKKPIGRLQSSQATVTYPENLSINDPLVQKAARSVSIRALRVQAENLLPHRLQTLSKKFNFNYHSVSVKQLKSRWGSCDSHQNIVLNLYLMQLPWELIDYVLIHELTHTVVMQHGEKFWLAMEKNLPGVREYRKKIKNYHPNF